jgi:hypothetical protein
MTFRQACRVFWRRPRRDPIIVPRFAYIVRHVRLAVYWRDPYGRYKRAGDPRSDWTPDIRRAYRFSTREQAGDTLRETGQTGFVILSNRE